MRRLCLYISALLLTSAPSITAGETADTINPAPTELREFIVEARRRPVEVIPVQRLAGDDLQRLNSQSVADALRYFSGIQIKDYGGVGGIKTVNIRSMGTNHSGVVYDGIELGNAQNGQIDLGQFSLDNVEAISLYNGQKSEILQPARDFGSAGTIYIRTRTPRFKASERFHGRLTFRTGSFDLINPSLLAEVRITDAVNASLSAEWIKSSGKYKFRYKRVNAAGQTVYDTTATRQNGDINALRTELNVNSIIAGGEWHAKVYHYDSDRGVPGAIVNNVWRRGERIADNNTFAQGSFSKAIDRFATLANIKYSYYRTHYVNNDDRQITIDNIYRQQEVYLSTANEYRILPAWRVSASYDFLWNTLGSDMYGFSRPYRYSHMAALASSLSLQRFKAQASIMGNFIHDAVPARHTSADRHAFTPALFVSAYPLRSPDFSLRAFVKRSFRMPTFNDLYYGDMGNATLRPEQVTQYNIGLLYDHTGRGILAAVRAGADAYINRVKDKIVAYPKGQQFRWTMLNLGLVDIKGIDLSALISLRPARDLLLTLRGQYTFQRAIDITSPSDSYYRHQIPYIPRHSGSAVLNASWRRWAFNCSYIYVGERYNQQENIAYNYTRPWYTTDLSLSRDFTFGHINFRALLEVNNVFSHDYDVIVNYPMPKRNFRLTLAVEL